MTPACTENAGFLELLSQHSGSLVRLARRLVGSPEDAEEIVQEALLRAYADRIRRARRGPQLTASVYRIARNLSIDHLRRKRLHLVDRDEMASRPDPRAMTPAEIMELDALREAVRRAVDELPAAYRKVIALRFGLGLTYRAIARELGTGLPAVEARLHRAKSRLRRSLRPWVSPAEATRTAAASV